jgi:hypothetical protein
LSKAQGLETVVGRWRRAAERAGVDIDRIESRIALGNAVGLIDLDEIRRGAIDGCGRNHAGNGGTGCSAGDKQHIDLVVPDRGRNIARIDRRNRHFVARHSVMAEHQFEQARGRFVAADDADALA